MSFSFNGTAFGNCELYSIANPSAYQMFHLQFELSNECPLCHSKIRPTPLFAHLVTYPDVPDDVPADFAVLVLCPGCGSHFFRIGKAAWDDENKLYYTFSGEDSPQHFVAPSFSEAIRTVSPSFVELYGQASFAESAGKGAIAGAGYRKSLEFLVKDYLLRGTADAEQQEKIKASLLSTCISNYVDNPRIKGVAARATWIGNDETHYVRKHKDEDIDTLKDLIELTLHWIEMELLTQKFEAQIQYKK